MNADALERQAAWLRDYRPALRIGEQGSVVSVGDGIAWIKGLPGAAMEEILLFADGSRGLVYHLTDRLLGAIDEDAVGRGVDDVVAAGAVVDARVSARQIALRIRQDPVAFERSADRAAVVPKLDAAPLAEALMVSADHSETQCHIVSCCGRVAAHPGAKIPVSPARESSAGASRL